MKIRNKLLIFILFFGLFLAMHNFSYAGTQRLNSLDFDVNVNEDGSMRVTETWDIYISETNTLFKDFEMDSSKYSGITDVSVSYQGRELTQIYEEMYHVTTDSFYALPISGNQFEIAWNVGLDNSSATRTYQISYTVNDAVTVYNDCSELYWMFLSSNNGISASNVTGTIKLPKAVSDLENLRVWAHGPLEGEIHKTANDTVSFELGHLSAQTMLEARIVVEEPIFTLDTKKVSQNKLDSILTEEQKWADDANRERNFYRLIFIGIAIIYILIFVFYFKKILRYKNELKEAKEENKMDIVDVGKYFRDIPREKESTPAEAAFLFYSNKNHFFMKTALDKVISATLLQLCLKKYISFDIDNKKEIHINLLKEPENNELMNTEKTVYRILKFSRSSQDNNSVTMDEIKKFARKNYDEFDRIMDSIERDAKNTHIDLKNYDSYKKEIVDSYNTKMGAYLFATFFLICFAGIGFLFLPILIEWIISAILLRKTANQYHLLTEQGEIERQEWNSLKNYMEDFSLLKEREVPDLVLWEKYLVYATAFGIADKVLKQLKIVYPQIQDLDSNTYAYLYLMSDSRFTNGFVNDLNKMTESAYNAYHSAYSAAHSSDSSGSGGGGGFSSGGGGRRRRRKHGRKIEGEKYENRN